MAFEPVITNERVDDIPLVLTQLEYMAGLIHSTRARSLSMS